MIALLNILSLILSPVWIIPAMLISMYADDYLKEFLTGEFNFIKEFFNSFKERAHDDW